MVNVLISLLWLVESLYRTVISISAGRLTVQCSLNAVCQVWVIPWLPLRLCFSDGEKLGCFWPQKKGGDIKVKPLQLVPLPRKGSRWLGDLTKDDVWWEWKSVNVKSRGYGIWVCSHHAEIICTYTMTKKFYSLLHLHLWHNWRGRCWLSA